MALQKYLDEQCEIFQFKWVTVISSDGLTICSSGIDESFDLAALLPHWMKTSHELARATKLEQGMGLICLVPESGSHLLLMKDFELTGERILILIAAPKMPKKAAKTVKKICVEIEKLLV